VIQLFVVEHFGYLVMFMVMAGLSLLSIFVVYFVFVEENPWKIENRYVLDDIN
jgi:Na+/H+-translocating membrane pyrophosphatase